MESAVEFMDKIPTLKKHLNSGEWDLIGNDEEELQDICTEYFFTSTYFGCGGVNGFSIKQVNPGEKIVCWNLD
jgi:hypothetical protein